MSTPYLGLWKENEEMVDGVTQYTASRWSQDHVIYDAQISGALDSLGTGVIKFVSTSFQVSEEAALYVNVAAGRAIVRHTEFGPAFIRSEVPIIVGPLAANATLKLFLIQETEGKENKDARPRFIFVDSGTTDYDGGVLLAEITTGASTLTTIADRRVFANVGALDIHALEDKTSIAAGDEAVIWDSESGELRKVALASLLAGLGGEGGESISWLSQLLYNVAHPVQADAYIDGRFSEIEERLVAAEGGPKKFPDELSLITDVVSGLGVGLFEVNPSAMLRVQMSALGRGFGKGQNSTPDVSPETGEANEANYDFITGLITP